MRPRIAGLTSAVSRVLNDHYPSEISWQQISIDIRSYVTIPSEQEEITYGQPNFQHSVRRTLTGLVRRGQVKRTRRGMYKAV